MSTNLPRPTSSDAHPATIHILPADLTRVDHQTHFLELLDAYMRHPMGDRRPLPEENRRKLVSDLKSHPASYILLAIDQQEEAVGMAVCFVGYSTFHAQPLMNIHDLFVKENQRGNGIGLRLLTAVESLATKLDCCKITLEVREDNARAHCVYREFGFDGGADAMAFWTKWLLPT